MVSPHLGAIVDQPDDVDLTLVGFLVIWLVRFRLRCPEFPTSHASNACVVIQVVERFTDTVCIQTCIL